MHRKGDEKGFVFDMRESCANNIAHDSLISNTKPISLSTFTKKNDVLKPIPQKPPNKMLQKYTAQRLNGKSKRDWKKM